jgi:hypothetical protein
MNAKLAIAAVIVAVLAGANTATAQSNALTANQQNVDSLYGEGAPSAFGVGANSYATSDIGSSLQGLGAMMAGAGQYNLNTAIAARYLAETQGKSIQNYRDAIDARYAIKRANDRYRAEKFASERMTPELLSRVIQAKLPDRLTATEYNRQTGALEWPAVLRGAEYFRDRHAIQDAFAQRRPEDVGSASAFFQHVSQHVENMHDIMLSRIDDMPTSDSVAARRFLKSLEYEARHLPEDSGLAINSR